jgi:hypothetical protein
LNDHSGVVCKVTVTPLGAYKESATAQIPETLSVVDGTPICQISGWPQDRFVDEPLPLEALIGKNTVSIWIGPKAVLSTVYQVENVFFVTDVDGFLRLLEFKEISEFNLERIMRTVGK